MRVSLKVAGVERKNVFQSVHRHRRGNVAIMHLDTGHVVSKHQSPPLEIYRRTIVEKYERSLDLTNLCFGLGMVQT